MSRNIEQELKKLNKTLASMLRLMQKRERAAPKGFLTEPLRFSPETMQELVEAVTAIKNQEEE